MSRSKLILAALLILSLLSGQADAAAGGRTALVIGNAAYQNTAPLTNPKNDALDVANILTKLGFKVIVATDLDKSGMDRQVRGFAEELGGAKLAVFFYAGHGLQVDLRNYLVPVDAKLISASSLDFEMVRLDLIQRVMERESKTNILFLDACRDNPLARNLARALGTRSTGIGRGLATVESGEGTLIAFSTQPGNVALDGVGRNSPFAGALVKYIGAPGEDISSVLISVRNDVMETTSRRQIPWDHSALTARVYFGGPPSNEQQAELALWSTVKEATDPALLQSYLDRFPKGTFSGVARIILEKLQREAELNRAEQARNAAEEAKRESERRADLARQADELKKAREEVRRSQEALNKAEKERDIAKKAANDARAAAEKAKSEPEAASTTSSATHLKGSNCFSFNNRTYCQ